MKDEVRVSRAVVENYGHQTNLVIDLTSTDGEGDSQPREIRLSFAKDHGTPTMTIHTSFTTVPLKVVPVAANEVVVFLE